MTLPGTRAVAPASGDPTDKEPLVALKDDRDPPDPPIRKTARVVRQRVIASNDMEDRVSEPGQRSRASGGCISKGTAVIVASRFSATPVFLDCRGNEQGEWRMHSEPPSRTPREWRVSAIAAFPPCQ